MKSAKHLGAVLLATLALQGPAHAAYPNLDWKVDSEAVLGLAGAVGPDGSVFDASFDASCLFVNRRDVATGEPIWTKFFCGDAKVPFVTLNVDSSGNAIVLWRFQSGSRMFAGKFAPDGGVVWQRAVNEEPGLAPSHAAIDPSDNIFVTGPALDLKPQNFVAKLSAGTGVVAWRANSTTLPVTITSDGSGNAIVGETFFVGTTQVAAVTKRSAAAGAVVWSTQFNNVGFQRFPKAIAVDAHDDILVTGGLPLRPGSTAFTTLKLLGASGTERWRVVVPEGVSSDSFGSAVAVDSGGFVVAASRATTVKLHPDSSTLWQVNSNYIGDPLLAIDGNDDIVIASTGEAGTQQVIRTLKYAGADGSEIWGIGFADGPHIDAARMALGIAPTGPVVFGTSTVDKLAQLRVVKYSSDPIASRNYQGLWWNSPANSESGWGLNVAHQGDVLFLTWFTYDLNGNPMWLVVSDARNAFGQTYSGKLYRTTGPRFDSVPFDPKAVALTEMGIVYIGFADASNGTFRYEFGASSPFPASLSKTKPITRQIFDARVPVCSPVPASGDRTYQDLWWASPPGSESGWGVNLTHQGDILFATWFTYDANGNGMWIVGSRLAKSAPGVYTGPLYRTQGATFASSPWPASVTITQVGTGTFTFADFEHGSFAYTVDGKSQTKAIVRQQFAIPATTCVFAPAP
jgi:hypothetical protein